MQTFIVMEDQDGYELSYTFDNLEDATEKCDELEESNREANTRSHVQLFKLIKDIIT